jgi:hypothetical protein
MGQVIGTGGTAQVAAGLAEEAPVGETPTSTQQNRRESSAKIGRGAISPLAKAAAADAAARLTASAERHNNAHPNITLAREAWQPNLVDLPGEPSQARSALRQSGKETVSIKTSTDALIGWGTASGATAFAFTGYELSSRKPVVSASTNVFETYWHRTARVGEDATGDLQRLAKDALGIDVDLESRGLQQLFDRDKGLLRRYHRTGQETFLRREFIHPLGFYPGDPTATGQAWQNAQDKRPSSTPDLEERRWVGSVVHNTGGYAQLWGVLNSKGSGVAILEYVPNRWLQTSYAYKSRTVEDGGQTVSASGVEGKFTQSVARFKLTTQGKLSAEVGNFSLANLSVLTTFKPQAKAASDWWLVEGRQQDNLRDPQQATRDDEFASLKAFGYELKGESLLPWMGDSDAHVFFKVPNANVNFGNRQPEQGHSVVAIPPDASQGEYFRAADGSTYQHPLAGSNEYRTNTDREVDEGFLKWVRRHLPFHDKRAYISVDNLAALMTQAASRAPEHIELAYVTPDVLVQANPDKVFEIVDPTTGEITQGFKVGDWVDTGLMQLEGQRGLFVDRERLPGHMFKADGSIDPQAELPHWLEHLSPQGVPALTTPRKAVGDH